MSNSYRNVDRKKYMDGAGTTKGKPKGEQKMKSEQRRAERALRTKDLSVLLDEDDESVDAYDPMYEDNQSKY